MPRRHLVSQERPLQKGSPRLCRQTSLCMVSGASLPSVRHFEISVCFLYTSSLCISHTYLSLTHVLPLSPCPPGLSLSTHHSLSVSLSLFCRYIPEFSVLSHSRVVVNPQRATADAAVSVTEPLLPTPVAVSTSTVGVQCEILSTHKPQLSNVGLRAESHNHNFDKQQHSHVNSGQTFDTTWGRRDVHSWQIPMTQPWHNQGKHGYANSAAPPPEPFAPPPQTRAFENTSPLGNSLGEAVAISFALNEL